MGAHKVRIIYKSGAEVEATCDQFKVKRNNVTGDISFEWQNLQPYPLLLGADDIAAVWQVK